jgi:hypothetical protein
MRPAGGGNSVRQASPGERKEPHDGVRADVDRARVFPGGVDRGVGVRRMMRLATREPAKIVALLAVFLMVVLAVSSCTFRLTPLDKPNGLTCGSPLVEVAAYTPRANGILKESHAFGCTFYFYETPSLPAEHERKGGGPKPPPASMIIPYV